MARVFVSHAGSNKNQVRFLADALEDAGHKLTFTADIDRGLPPSEDWINSIQQLLLISDLVVFWITKDWLASRWCFLEYILCKKYGIDLLVFKDPKTDFEAVANIQWISTNVEKKKLLEIAVLFAGRHARTETEKEPYPGFSAYDESMARFYSGRPEFTRDQISWLKQYRKDRSHTPLRALFGSSGVGKTSLLRAGIYASVLAQEEKLGVRLETLGWLTRRTKVVPTTTRERSIAVATAFDPVEPPRDAVRRILTELALVDSNNEKPTDLSQLASEVVARFRGEGRSDSGVAKAVILIDAFERFYEIGCDDVRAVLVRLASEARINVLATIRSSALQNLTDDAVLRGRMEQLQVREIDPESFPDIISEPALRSLWSVSADLRETLTTYFKSHNHSLPLLSYVMSLVWKARLRNADAQRFRILTLDLLYQVAGTDRRNPQHPVDVLIENLCFELDGKLNEEMFNALSRLLFRMCRYDEASDEIRSVGCKLSGDETERRLVTLLCSPEYRLFTHENWSDSRGETVRPTHDRILEIWTRARGTLAKLKPDFVLRARIDRELSQILERGTKVSTWLGRLEPDDASSVVEFFEKWLNHLDVDIQKAWLRSVEEQQHRNEALVQTQRLLSHIGARRASLAGILAELKLREGNPLEAVQVALAAPDIGPNGKPYKAVVTALVKGLHNLREVQCFDVRMVPGISGSKRLYGGTWDDETQSISAFSGGDRITWSWDQSAHVTPVIPRGHTAVWTATDGAWGCVFSARDDNRYRVTETQVAVHHPNMRQPARYLFGRKRIWNAALFEGSEELFLAITWNEEELDHAGNSRTCFGICRLNKSELRAASEGPTTRFLPIFIDSREWLNVEIRALAWAGAGPRLFIGGRRFQKDDRKASFGSVWEISNISTGLELGNLAKEVPSLSGKSITSAALSRDGRTLITGGSDGRALLHYLDRTGVESRPLSSGIDGVGDNRAHNGRIGAIAISRDGSKAFTGSTDDDIRMWDVTTGQLLSSMRGHRLGVRKLIASRDGSLLCSFGHDGTARVWDVEAKAPRGVERSLTDRPVLLHYRSNTNLLCLCSDGKAYSFEEGKRPNLFCEFKFEIASAGTIPDAHNQNPGIMVGGKGVLSVWSSDKASPVNFDIPLPTTGRPSTATSICCTSDGNAYVGLDDGRLLYFKLRADGTCEFQHKLGPLKTPIRSLAMLCNGQVLVGRSDASISLWSPSDDKIAATIALPGHKSRGRTLAAVELPSLGLVATAGSIGRRYPILMLEKDSLEIRHQLLGHSAPIDCLAVLGDGRTLVSGARDCTLRFWDAVARIELGSIRVFDDWITALAVSPSGTIVATGEAERVSPRVRIWGAQPTHYSSVDWQSATAPNYSGPAFIYAAEATRRLRPNGLSEDTRDRYMLDREDLEVPSASHDNYDFAGDSSDS